MSEERADQKTQAERQATNSAAVRRQDIDAAPAVATASEEPSASAADKATDKAAAKIAARWLTAQSASAGHALVAAMGAGVVGGLLVIGQSALLAWILSQTILAGAALSQVAWPLAGLALLYLARAITAYIQGVAGFTAGARVRQAVRLAVARQIHDLGPAHSQGQRAGALLTTAQDQSEALEGYYARYLPQKTLSVFVPLAMVAAVFPVDWLAGTIFLITLPLVPLFMAVVGMGAAAASRRQAVALARMSGFFLDRLRNLATIKSFGQTERELAAVIRVSHDYRDKALGVLRLAFLSSAVLEFFAVISIAMVALYIGMSLLDLFHLGPAEDVTLFIGLFVLMLAPEIFLPLRKLAVYYHERATALAAAEQLEGLLAQQLSDHIPPANKAETSRPDRGPLGLEIRSLSKTFEAGTRPVLNKVTLTIAPGEKVALVGPSGSGKSTLIATLMGFAAADGGEMLAMGPAGQEVALQVTHLAWLGQRPHLFHGSLADNIRLGRPSATDQEVLAAADAAEVLSFAEDLPDGMDTPLGEDGHGLSGGEAQRVALARAFLRDAPIVLLDEPTARLDKKNEAAILAALDRLMEGRTVLVATHSPAVISRMDRVVLLSNLSEPRPVEERLS